MKKSFWVILIILGLGVFGYYGITGYLLKGTNVNPKFVDCIIEKGAVMYGAEWCPHCQDQKAMFGRLAVKELYDKGGYVECPENQKLCDSKGITGYPTWIINGTTYQGVQSIEELAAITGCELSYE